MYKLLVNFIIYKDLIVSFNYLYSYKNITQNEIKYTTQLGMLMKNISDRRTNS